MKKFVAIVLCLSMFFSLTVRVAHAEDPKPASSSSVTTPPVQDIPPGKDKIVPLRKGDPAPFDGQLFDTDTALRWGNWLLQYKFRLKADVEYQKKLGDADTELWHHKYTLLDDKYTTVTGDYQKRVADLEAQSAKYRDEIANPPWYRSPLFGFISGVVITGACVGLGFYTYRAVKQ